MNEPEDILTDASQPEVPKGQGKDDYVPLTKSEAESLRRERDESRASERAWADIARGTRQAPPAPVEQELPDASEFLDPEETHGGVEDDTPERFVDDFAKSGSAAISKRGFVTRAEAIKMATDAAIKVSNDLIGRNNQRTSSDQAILTEFGDLKNPESALYKETAIRYQRAIKMDPGAAKTPAALYLAAEGARDVLKAREASKPKADPDEAEDETDRQHRAASQDGRTRSRGASDDATDMLGPEANAIIKGFGITEAEYRASQKATGARGARR
jgi:hypothetical protein